MKKILVFLVIAVTCIAVLVGCSAGNFAAKDDGYLTYDPSGGAPMVSGPADDAPNYNFEDVTETGFMSTTENSKSFFSLDRNTASYSVMRRQINSGLAIHKNSVRLEEYINYFNYDYVTPTGEDALAVSGTLFDTPYNGNTKLFTIGVAAERVQFENPKPNNLVFLIDTSGSMNWGDRLPLIQQSFTMLLDYLGSDDIISIVTYAGDSRVALSGARGLQKTQIANVLQDLTAQGGTNGEGGIRRAYAEAEKYFVQGGNNRVILATDGDFNIGVSDKDSLKNLITNKKNSGIYLSVLGVGMGNTNDTTMNTLATNGNGNYAYIDDVKEAYKVLVEEMEGTFNVVAKDAKIGVEFNPDVVESYRLIGYETKVMTEDEFQDTKKDAGEIGSGHTVTAVYELVLKEHEDNATFATAEIKYKDPATDESKSITATFDTSIYTATPTEDSAFIGCVVEYGLLLRQSEYKADASFANVIARLGTLQCVVDDQFKAEFLEIVQKAYTIDDYLYPTPEQE